MFSKIDTIAPAADFSGVHTSAESLIARTANRAVADMSVVLILGRGKVHVRLRWGQEERAMSLLYSIPYAAFRAPPTRGAQEAEKLKFRPPN
jgi:hypothetical protein